MFYAMGTMLTQDPSAMRMRQARTREDKLRIAQSRSMHLRNSLTRAFAPLSI